MVRTLPVAVRSGNETEELWLAFVARNESYAGYWKLANRTEYEQLFSDHEFLARMDAFIRRNDDLMSRELVVWQVTIRATIQPVCLIEQFCPSSRI
jgi:hypothetical protein